MTNSPPKSTLPLIYLFFLFFVFLFNGCSSSTVEPEETIYREPGEIIRADEIAVYTPAQIEQILQFLNIEHTYQFTYTVKVIQIEYQTASTAGKPLPASGAIIIPVTAASLPVLSINHGTETLRTGVASEGVLNSVEGVTGLITASLGFITCIPDYIGFGVSTEMHPYVHAKSLAISITDLLKATAAYLHSSGIDYSGHLYLTGYSEGGYATLAAQREIEQDFSVDFDLIAVAPMAGPYDLAGVVDSVLSQDSYPSPVYIAFLLTAYNSIYGWNRLTDIFNPAYAALMPGFFDGTKSYSEIHNQLPKKISSLLKPEFITNFLQGKEVAIHAAFQENSLLDWSPQTQIRFFHGDADLDVPYVNVLNTINRLTDQSDAPISLVTIEGGTHESSGLPCIFGMIDWFEGLENTLTKNNNLASASLLPAWQD